MACRSDVMASTRLRFSATPRSGGAKHLVGPVACRRPRESPGFRPGLFLCIRLSRRMRIGIEKWMGAPIMFVDRPWFKSAMAAVWILCLASFSYTLYGKLEFVAGCDARLVTAQGIA